MIEPNALDRLTKGYGYVDTSFHPSHEAATVIVQLVRERLGFKSVLDVGCGIGIWLAEFQRQGATEIVGIDGDWVPKDKLLIPQSAFRIHDLTGPIRLGRTFDIVISLEVAEHVLPVYDDVFVESLISHGDTIVFSGAIPGQGGFQHVNEQPQDYWIAKFAKFGFLAYDVIRPAVWRDNRVPFYYAQNTLVFSRRSLPYPTEFIPSPVHPALLQRKMDPRGYSLRLILRNLPFLLRASLRSLLKRP